MWPIKNFEKYFMAHQFMPKIFHDPHKHSPVSPPTYLMYGPLVKIIQQNRTEQNECSVQLTCHIFIIFILGFKSSILLNSKTHYTVV